MQDAAPLAAAASRCAPSMRVCSISGLFDACSLRGVDVRLVGDDEDAPQQPASTVSDASHPPEAASASAATPPETVRPPRERCTAPPRCSVLCSDCVFPFGFGSHVAAVRVAAGAGWVAAWQEGWRSWRLAAGHRGASGGRHWLAHRTTRPPHVPVAAAQLSLSPPRLLQVAVATASTLLVQLVAVWHAQRVTAQRVPAAGQQRAEHASERHAAAPAQRLAACGRFADPGGAVDAE